MFKRLLKSIICLSAVASPLSANSKQEPVQTVILGGGIGALTSAVYLQRAGVQAFVIEGRDPGGAIAQSPHVQNWPGEVEIDGYALIEKVRKQAEVNGAKILSQEVVAVDFSNRPYKVTTRDLDEKKQTRDLYANSVIIATGATPKLLGVPGESKYWTRGVYTCATCDGALFKDKTVAVIGGGDSAVLEAEYLSKIAKKVMIFVRSGDFRASETVRKDHVLKSPNVEVHYHTTIQEVKGNGDKTTSLTVKSNGKTKDLPVDGVFLAIGATPNSRLFQGQLEINRDGYIVLKDTQRTSLAGVYAIGDVVDPYFKQAISAAGDGAKAALQAERDLGALAKTETKQSVSNPVQVVPVANSEGVIDLSSADQLADALASATMPIFVEFYSPYCGPCRKIAPAVEQAAQKYAGRVKFIKVNVSEFNSLSSQYNVYGVPTAILFDAKGQETDRRVGPDQINSLLNSLDKK